MPGNSRVEPSWTGEAHLDLMIVQTRMIDDRDRPLIRPTGTFSQREELARRWTNYPAKSLAKSGAVRLGAIVEPNRIERDRETRQNVSRVPATPY